MDDDGENQFHFSDEEEEEDHHQDELNKKKKKKKKKIPIINKKTVAMMVDRNSSSSSSMENINSSLLRLKFKIPSINNSPSTECSGDEGAALLFPHQTSSPQGLPDAAQQQEIRVCRICKKGFPSGRALGGHMRIHNNNTTHADDDEDEFPKKLPNPNKQLKKQLKASALLSLSNNAASLAAAGEEEPTTINCAICNKTFRSNKSLFGHMRCHPNREWRGILPPPPPPNASTKNSPSSTVSNSLGCHKMEDQIDSAAATPALVIGSSSQSVDPVRALPRWSVKARRGRAANTNANQEIPEAAYDLMMLSRGESLDSGLSNFKQRSYDELDNIKKRSSEESETGNFNSRDLIIRKPEMGSGSGRKRKRSYLDGSEGEQEEDGDYNDVEKPLSETEFYDGSLVLAKMKKKKKKKKKKLNLRDLEREDNMSGVNVVNEYKQSQSQHLHKFSADKYKCTTCSKSFPSHQALGGHRSSHYKIKISPSLHPQDEFAFGTALALAQSQAPTPAPAEEEEEEEEVEEHYEVVPFPNTTNLAQLNDPTEYVILGSNSRLVNGTASTYMCEICNRTFSTGQALGGHKRCHWTPVEVHPSSVALQFYEEAPPAPASKSASDSGTGQRMLAFDLNELPTTTAEDGDEEDQGGMKQIVIVDYASSSENSAN